MSGGEAGPPATTVLVLGGGIALGAFGAGACEAVEEQGGADWLLGSSAGALNAAIIAGNPPGQRVEALHRFWSSASADPTPWASFWLGPPPGAGAWRRAHNETAAWQTLLLGRPGLFRHRRSPGETPSLYDLEPLRRRLPEFVDFGRLGAKGAPRLTIVATDVESGDRVVFDTARGARIGPEHLLASCALMPLFPPIEIDGRLLCDGGLASNAPVDLVFAEPSQGPVRCIVTELFARAGQRPRSLAAAAGRAADLAFGNQTWRMIEAGAREHALRARLAQLAAQGPGAAQGNQAPVPPVLDLLLLDYRAGLDEAGPGKPFDFSRATVEERWQAGATAMREGGDRLQARGGGTTLAPGFTLFEMDGGAARPAK
ncbi:NTE family protein [Roseomonas rosea]|uniref:NTE family protein n=1 Tax=Muricoccus roseus TaxID=198092 RepID=A0A1M6D5I5_9PROT|nr:patatin-like phospholipase family protein [Roseomonas rosea]SHI68542.1 NTE family protein [Roseomonas rosea]